MAQETKKATNRRMGELGPTHWNKWSDRFRGDGLDVGPGDDLLVWPGCDVTGFDKEQGDANRINEYFSEHQFDFIHGSQVLEHLVNPADFINRCLRILKPGGWVVMTVPDFDLYEKRQYPSLYNPDHRSTWSLWRQSDPVSATQKRIAQQKYGHRHVHIHVPTWIHQFNLAHREARLIDTNYDYLAPDSKDQTWLLEDGVECFLELLMLKHA